MEGLKKNVVIFNKNHENSYCKLKKLKSPSSNFPVKVEARAFPGAQVKAKPVFVARENQFRSSFMKCPQILCLHSTNRLFIHGYLHRRRRASEEEEDTR